MTEGCGKSVWNGYNAGTHFKPLGGVIPLCGMSPRIISVPMLNLRSGFFVCKSVTCGNPGRSVKEIHVNTLTPRQKPIR